MDGVLRSFQAFMDGGGNTRLLGWCLTLLVSAPLLTLVHELGHASIGLARMRGLVRVHVGREPGIVRGRLGRLILTFDPRPGSTREGFAQIVSHLSRGEQVAFVLAGPAAEALVAAALIGSERPRLQVVGAFGAVAALYNLVPHVRRGHASDGEVLRRTLRLQQWRTRTAADDMRARANAFYADLERHMTEARRRVLAHGVTRPELLRAAYAGWCWGEASSGEWAREAALDALHAATQSGAVEPELTVRAALALSRSPQPPGRHVELGFAGVRLADFNEAAQRTVFLFGIAVNDIERIRA